MNDIFYKRPETRQEQLSVLNLKEEKTSLPKTLLASKRLEACSKLEALVIFCISDQQRAGDKKKVPRYRGFQKSFPELEA